MTSDGFFILCQIIECLIGAVSVVGNGLVFYVVFRFRFMKTPTNHLIASLAAADFLVGCVGIPMVIALNFELHVEFYGCLMMSSIVVILTQISIFNLLAIAFERYLAVRMPHIHRNKFQSGILGGVIVTCWLAGILVGMVPLFGWHLASSNNLPCRFVNVISMPYMVYFNFFGFVLTPLCLTFAIYASIFHFIRGRNQRLYQSSSRSVLSTGLRNMKNCPRVESQNDLQKHKTLNAKEFRAAKRIFIVVVMFAVCWLPLHIMNMITLFLKQTNSYGLNVAVLLSHSNSAINPFLYAIGNPMFIEAFRKVFRVFPDEGKDGQLRDASGN